MAVCRVASPLNPGLTRASNSKTAEPGVSLAMSCSSLFAIPFQRMVHTQTSPKIGFVLFAEYPHINIEPDIRGIDPGLDHFSFEGTGSRTSNGSM